MSYRILSVLFLAGTTVSLAAQSTVSFETYADTYKTNGGGSMVAGDFNNDGKPDLITCCNSATQMVFRSGNGNGTFAAPVVAAATPVALSSAVAADVNGDGKLDLVTVADQNPPAPPGSGNFYLTIYLGNGNGTFAAPKTYNTTEAPNYVLVGNFFGDGHVDIAVIENSATIDLFRNEGNGGFVLDKSINMGGGPYAVMTGAAGDLNGTGVTDLAIMELAGTNNGINFGNPQQLFVLWNDGKGNFTQEALGSDYNFPSLAVNRLNGTAQMDIIVGYVCENNNACMSVDVYYGQGGNKLVKKTVISTTVGPNPGDASAIAGVDVNGDGIGDIITFSESEQNCPQGCNTDPGGAYVWLGKADGTFEQTPQQFFTSNVSDVGQVAMGDFNRDGLMDFAYGIPGTQANTQYFINASERPACGRYTISPTVTMCQPVDNTYSPSPVRVAATAYDTDSVTAMQEYIDNKLVYSKAVTSFDTTFSVADGTHALQTKAWDTTGRDFVADRTVTVYSGTPGATCAAGYEAASICLPAGDTSSSPVEILANGDAGAAVPTAAQLYIDGKLVVDNKAQCNTSTECYGADSFVQTTQTLDSGSHDLVFKIWDTAGKVYEAQKTVTVN